MDRHPEQYRHLMHQRMAEQRRHADRRALKRRASARPPLRHGLARSLFRAAFALDSAAVWSGLWEKLSPAEARTGRERGTG